MVLITWKLIRDIFETAMKIATYTSLVYLYCLPLLKIEVTPLFKVYQHDSLFYQQISYTLGYFKLIFLNWTFPVFLTSVLAIVLMLIFLKFVDLGLRKLKNRKVFID